MKKKNELVGTVAEKVGFTKKDCLAVIDAYNETLFEALVDGEEVAVGDTGKFKFVETKARAGRTMVSGLTGQEIVIPAKEAGTKLVFKISSKLKDSTK